ncbi:MAG: rod shape-determining protein [Oscillospiraceae bacterium]|jgi:rod shape-determining protein MreB|nr:rod shape-determining protein [Oscillospiraceae bacterium]
MVFFERDIAIDLGTSSLIVYVSGKGITLREPTIVAVDKHSGRLLKVGEDAQKMLGRTPANIVAIHPIINGVVSDYDMTVRMLKELIQRITSFSLFKPRLVICVPGSITGVEERATIDAGIEAGARKVYLLESSVASALGAGADISRPDGYMVLDIGGGTTEVGVVSLGGVVESESIKTAGNAFDEALVKYIRRKHNLLIGLKTAEELKIRIGSACPVSGPEGEEVKGRCLMTGLPRSVTVDTNDIAEALTEPLTVILDAVQMVLERTPPELVADISRNGIIICGGGCLIPGLDKIISAKTGISVNPVDDPVTCTAYGAGKRLGSLSDMEEGMINLARKRLMK